jgi:hypothetical protein
MKLEYACTLWYTITSITAVLLPFVTYLLTLPRIWTKGGKYLMRVKYRSGYKKWFKIMRRLEMQRKKVTELSKWARTRKVILFSSRCLKHENPVTRLSRSFKFRSITDYMKRIQRSSIFMCRQNTIFFLIIIICALQVFPTLSREYSLHLGNITHYKGNPSCFQLTDWLKAPCG